MKAKRGDVSMELGYHKGNGQASLLLAGLIARTVSEAAERQRTGKGALFLLEQRFTRKQSKRLTTAHSTGAPIE